MFEYYVLNYDSNAKKVVNFNIFQNIRVDECTEKAVKKYLRSPSKYKVYSYKDNKDIYGFDALCEAIRSCIMSEEWSRCEYEIAVGELFIPEVNDILRDFDKYKSLDELKTYLEKQNSIRGHLEKWDCYRQCEKNIPMIARECIYQYKEYKKNGSDGKVPII